MYDCSSLHRSISREWSLILNAMLSIHRRRASSARTALTEPLCIRFRRIILVCDVSSPFIQLFSQNQPDQSEANWRDGDIVWRRSKSFSNASFRDSYSSDSFVDFMTPYHLWRAISDDPPSAANRFPARPPVNKYPLGILIRWSLFAPFGILLDFIDAGTCTSRFVGFAIQ